MQVRKTVVCVWAARTLIDRRTAEIHAQVSSGEPAEGMFLTYLLASDRLSRAEVYITVTELLLGGVDTVRGGGGGSVHHNAVCEYRGTAGQDLHFKVLKSTKVLSSKLLHQL